MPKLKPDEILDKIQEFRRHGESINRNDFDRMRKARRFKIGKQWDDDVLEYYKSKRKHALTINRVLPTVLQVCGTEIQNKKDIKARPVKGGTATAANIITALCKHAMDQSFADFQKSQMFENGITTGKGYLYVEKDYSEDPKNGNLKIRKLNPFRVIVDKTEDYDPNISARYMIFDEWYDKEKLEKEYPDKKADLGDVSYSTSDRKTAWGTLISFFYPAKTEGYDDVESEDMEDSRYKYRLTHTFWKEYRKCLYIYRLDKDDLSPMKVVKSEYIKYAKEAEKDNPRLISTYEAVDVLMHHTKSVGDILLEDIPNPFPNTEDASQGVTMFPIVPFHPYFVDGYSFGIVENLIGPQEEHNYSRSQTLNIIKRLANVGWIVGKLMGKAGSWLRDHAAEDGIVIDASKYGGRVDKIEETKLPDAHAFIAERSAQDMAEIANVRMEKPEFDEKNMSGRAIALKQQASMTGSAMLFANYDYSIRIFATLLMEIIRNCGVYSEAEIMAIVDESDLIDTRLSQQAAAELARQDVEMPDPPADIPQAIQLAQTAKPEEAQILMAQVADEIRYFQKAQQQYQVNVNQKAKELLFAQMKTIATGRYGIKVDASDNAPTMRMAHFLEILELHKLLVESGQPGINREDLIMASDIKNKEDIAKSGIVAQPQAA